MRRLTWVAVEWITTLIGAPLLLIGACLISLAEVAHNKAHPEAAIQGTNSF